MNKKITSAILILFFSSIDVAMAQDTIPFSLGNDNRIYIKVSVNHSEALEFIFDTGANGMVANTTQTDSKLSLIFDDETKNIGANGISIQKVSTSNTLKIGNFRRKNEELVGIAYPREHYSFDGVIGYPFFEDYLIEINYDTQNIVLHKRLKTITNLKEYEKLKMKMIGEVPFVDFTIMKNNEPIVFPVMIDTGYNGSLIVYYKTVSEKRLDHQFQSIRSSRSEGTDGTSMTADLVLIPEAQIGKKTIIDVYANLNKTPSNMIFPAIMGGEILKQLHWIIDFKDETVYVADY